MKSILLAVALATASLSSFAADTYHVVSEPGVTVRLTSNQGKCRGGLAVGIVDFSVVGGKAEDMCWMLNRDTERIIVQYTDGVLRAYAVEDLSKIEPVPRDVEAFAAQKMRELCRTKYRTAACD